MTSAALLEVRSSATKHFSSSLTKVSDCDCQLSLTQLCRQLTLDRLQLWQCNHSSTPIPCPLLVPAVSMVCPLLVRAFQIIPAWMQLVCGSITHSDRG